MRRRQGLRFTFISLLLMMVAMGCVTAQKSAEPAKQAAAEDWKFHTIVDVEFVKGYVEVPVRKDVMIIDSRPKRAKYDKGHIPGAVSIPDTQFAKMTDKLPTDKETPLIFYCGGFTWKLSHKSARKAEKLGYKNVQVFAAGYPEWLKQPGHYGEVTVDYVKSLVDKKADVMIIDSRPKRAKYDKGHIPGAVSIPDTQFVKMTDQLPQNKETPLIFYCGGYTWKLSHKSARKAGELGYKKVSVFAAGYPAWKKVAGAGAAKPMASDIKAGKEEGSIDIAAFEKILKENPQSILLIDVRDADEYAAGTFKTAKNIPVDQLEKEIKTLPADKPIVFVCATGARSGESYYMVKDTRPDIKDVYYLEAEVTYSNDGSYTIKPTPWWLKVLP